MKNHLIAGILLLVLLLTACGAVNDTPEIIQEKNEQTLLCKGHTREEAYALIETLAKLNEPAGLGTERITKASSFVLDASTVPAYGNYHEELLWFVTENGTEYYAFVKGSVVWFICRGPLDSGTYIWKTVVSI